jgi:prepilin-type processing-associated H-X9-DG protein
MLVTIAIIVVALSMLMPVIYAARRHADGTICQGRLRSISIAMNAYANDNKGKIPGGLNVDGTPGTWADVVVRYVDPEKSRNHAPLAEIAVLQCSSHPLSGQIDAGYSMNFSPSEVAVSSPHAGQPSQIGSVRRSSTRIWFIDSADDFGGWGAWNEYPSAIGPLLTASQSVPDPVYIASMHMVLTGAQLPSGPQHTIAKQRHGRQKINALYFDGHVSLIDSSKLTIQDFNLNGSAN